MIYCFSFYYSRENTASEENQQPTTNKTKLEDTQTTHI